MAKKSKKQSKSLIAFLVAIVAIAASAFIFAPALGIKDTETTFTGIEITFGKEIANIWVAQSKLTFSILALLAYALPLAAAIIILLFNKKFGSPLAALLLMASAVLLFVAGKYIKVESTILGNVVTQDINWVLVWGIIASGVLSSLGALMALFETYRAYK